MHFNKLFTSQSQLDTSLIEKGENSSLNYVVHTTVNLMKGKCVIFQANKN